MGFFRIIQQHGPERAVGVIHRYGAPATMGALALSLEYEAQETSWKTYVADLLWVIARKDYENFPIQPYSEMMAATHKTNDTRSAEEIREHILERIRGE